MFFRKKTEPERRPASRGGAAEAARIKELRIQARRRLVGALVLVLTAFILVTWLFDEPVSEPAPAPIIVPAPPSGLPSGDEFSALPGSDDPAIPDTASGLVTPLDDTPGASANASDTPPAESPADTQASTPSTRTETGTDTPASQPVESAPARDAARPAPAAGAEARTDDGAVALALLAGKTPPSAASASGAAGSGRYYLQVAAYATEQDAIKRRDSLHQAGVSNAYVETAQSGGRTVHRLRVGPFSSHEAAQAAQTRLRALGYENGLIAGQ
ncbi:SPOR domain-containing protein [Castellaniella sp.]|uniref:SPOR domain-containing protein n=1 Tax=Castellaniella sp. TaxID=1955812 RepID=UPI00355F3893